MFFSGLQNPRRIVSHGYFVNLLTTSLNSRAMRPRATPPSHKHSWNTVLYRIAIAVVVVVVVILRSYVSWYRTPRERCESSCPQKAHSSSRPRCHRSARPCCPSPLRTMGLSSSTLQTEVSSRRAPPMRIPRAWIKGRALGWLVLIYPRASVFPLLLFRRFSRTPESSSPSSPCTAVAGRLVHLREMPSSTRLSLLSPSSSTVSSRAPPLPFRNNPARSRGPVLNKCAVFSVPWARSHPAGPHDVAAISLTGKRDGKVACVPA